MRAATTENPLASPSCWCLTSYPRLTIAEATTRYNAPLRRDHWYDTILGELIPSRRRFSSLGQLAEWPVPLPQTPPASQHMIIPAQPLRLLLARTTGAKREFHPLKMRAFTRCTQCSDLSLPKTPAVIILLDLRR